ncbi:hypothetical protein [Methanobrevibacter sp. DSM 116169]|uniref:hypothetical protein n=1 Tax=Methanobrevibacter sp. DSM 116169 TaxID=3242727 RepID=UPI0038FC5FDC
MGKKTKIFIIIILILAISVFLLNTIEKTESFDDKYNLDVPISSNFIKNESQGIPYFIDYTNQIGTAYIEINSIEELLATKAFKEYLENQEEKIIINNTTIYKINFHELLNETEYNDTVPTLETLGIFKYIYISVNDYNGIFIIVGSFDADKTIKLSQSIDVNENYKNLNYEKLLNNTTGELKDGLSSISNSVENSLKSLY